MVEIEGQPWFVATDVYALLYGRTTGHSWVRLALGDDESMILRKQREPNSLSSLFVGPAARVSLITESGLYKLVLRSDKPEAKDFQNWVTRVVLPAIRKDGGYIHGEQNGVSGAMTE